VPIGTKVSNFGAEFVYDCPTFACGDWGRHDLCLGWAMEAQGMLSPAAFTPERRYVYCNCPCHRRDEEEG